MNKQENNFYSILSNLLENEGNYSNLSKDLFNEIKITIPIIGIRQPNTENKVVYKILNLKTESTKVPRSLAQRIKKINVSLLRNSKDLGYIGEEGSWKLFYLLKDLITTCEKLKYNYFRGQARNWRLVPGIFRENINHGNFYTKFERQYKNISREFPNNLSYFPLEGKNSDEKRTDELAILQHYGFPTPLVDITANPFIALLFMCGFNEKWKKPQFQCFKVDADNIENSLFTLVHKVDINKRLRAQQGAFLNYEKLYKYFDTDSGELKLSKSQYRPIDVITFTIDFRLDETIKNQKEFLSNTKGINTEMSDINSKEIENYLVNSNNSNKVVEEYYEYIKSELKNKLSEYGYKVSNLFPDFSDYIKYTVNDFKDGSEELKWKKKRV